MNVVKVKGGLGNQLFQYAFGRVLQECSGNKTGYNIEWYQTPRVPPRPYVLDTFQISVNVTNYLQTKKVFERIGGTPSLQGDKQYFDGYWQNPNLYPPALVEELRAGIHVKPNLYTKEFLKYRELIRGCTAVALHVRRGDYLIHPSHLVLPLRYYQNALMHMDALKKDIQVFIFSDDIEWCSDNFDGCFFVSLPEDYLEFELMRECKHFIIANSTFSWWAAYLAMNATIISPRKWWRNSVNGYAVYERRMVQGTWLNIGLS